MIDSEVYDEAYSTVEGVKSGELRSEGKRGERGKFEVRGESTVSTMKAYRLHLERLLEEHPDATESVLAAFRDSLKVEDGTSSLASLGETGPYTRLVNGIMKDETAYRMSNGEEELQVDARGISREYGEKFWQGFIDEYGDQFDIEALDTAISSYEGIQWGQGAGTKPETAPLLEYGVEKTGNTNGTEHLDWWSEDNISNASSRQAVGTFARENQKEVRELLQPRGDTIRLYRGIKADDERLENPPQNPVEHWTVSPVTAQFFGQDGYVLVDDVPVDDIIAWSGVSPQRPQQASEFVIAREEDSLEPHQVIPEEQFDEFQHTLRVVENLSSLPSAYESAKRETVV